VSDILIKNAKFAITMDERRRILRDCAIAVNDGKIIAIGKDKKITKEYSSSDVVIDAGKTVVCPGLINAHCHTTQQLAKGLADNVFLPTWIHDRLYPFEANQKPEDVYFSSMLCFIEAIKTGTTYLADPGGYHMEQVVEAAKEIGIRAVLARSLVDIHASGRPIPESMREGADEAVKSGEDFVRKFDGAAKGRVHAWFSLRTERMVSNDLCSRVKKLADKYHVGIESHVSSNLDSVNRHKEVFEGNTPIRRYKEAGVLGPNLLIVHANWLTDEEIELVKKFDVKVVHCPTAGAAGGYGTFKVGKFVEMMEKGITVSLGHDSAAESNFMDMIRVAQMAGAHRDVRLDATLFPPETLLEMLTIHGSRALLSDAEVGSLQVGKKADLVLFDLERPDMVPLHNPVSNLIHAGSGESANTVIIDGKVVMQNRKIETVDESEILSRAQKAAEEVAERAGLTAFTKPKWKYCDS
jgi:5-methylthioadenosine/S-adenosylhomocysteine deaminase